VFVAFQINARIREAVERRNVLCAMACLFAASFLVVYLAPNLLVIAAFFIISRIGVALWLFNLYNYTAVAYPTRMRAAAFAWTDGLGHLGAWAGVTLLGPLYAWGPNQSRLVPVAADSWLPDPGLRDPHVRHQAIGRSTGTGLDLRPAARQGRFLVAQSVKSAS
jgi:MFS family permease